MIPVDQKQLTLLAARLGSIGVRRREFLKVAGVLTGAAAVEGALGALAQAQTARPSGVKLAKEQVFRWAYPNEPSSLDLNRYLYGSGDAGLWAWLMKFDPDYKPIPWLAERFEASPTGDVYTFYLRPGLQWSNGDAVTAHDFIWSYQRKLDPATAADYPGFFYDIKNAEKINKGEMKDLSQLGAKAKDDLTLEFTLEGPRGYFHVLMAYAATAPAHKATVEKFGDKWTEPGNIVSNGMYVLESWEHNKRLVLKKNPLYFEKDKITIEKIVRPIITLQAHLLAYENNEVDVVVEVPASDFKRLQNDPKLSQELIPYDAPITWYLTPQVTHPPFDDLRVRQAVSHAIDRKTIAEKVIQGLGIPAHAFIPPGIPGHLEAAKYPQFAEIQKFDPRLALESLKGSKYEGGRHWPKITLTMREEGPNPKAMAEAIQAMLAQHLRMHIELEILEQRVFRERLWKLDLQFIFIRWFADYPDPHSELYDTLYSKLVGGRRQAWSNPEFDTLLEKGRETLDWNKRFELYMQAEEILQQDVGYVPVVWGQYFSMFKPWVQGQPRNSREQVVVDGNIYRWAREHMYIVEH
ncbi:MAG TPA: peptide ABC transporter substrate-binding protein [Candidatus Tectomicrobia bacterium]|jgi:ABC-type oligopeptide transport system substrate-binding subunit